MARYDVFVMPGTSDLLLDVQSSVLRDLATRAVIPLVLNTQSFLPASKLNPIFHIGDNSYVMMTHFVTSVPARDLRNRLTNLERDQYRISLALDMPLFGF